MIRNLEQLSVVRRQLNLAEDALVALHERLHTTSPRNYLVYAESYIDMILQLRAEIDEFLGIRSATSREVVENDVAPANQDTAGIANPLSVSS